MTDKRLEDINISSCNRLITPHDLKHELPLTQQVAETVINSRSVIRDILDRKDARLMIVVGPCSIHDPKAAIEYGERLRKGFTPFPRTVELRVNGCVREVGVKPDPSCY